jgi:pentatricopeptide repeat protein
VGGGRADARHRAAAVEKAFAFVDWMVQLTTEGDAFLEVPALPHVQPSYALNTIVTASQRAGSLEEAERAFELLLKYGYEPDVFTYTALIDVTARSGDVSAAIAVRVHLVAACAAWY